MFSWIRYNLISLVMISWIRKRFQAGMPKYINQVATKRRVQNGYISIRPMNESDIPQVMELRRAIGSHDINSSLLTWLTVDPKGIQVVENEAGEIIGSCSAIKQNDNLYFLGLYNVREDYKGFKIGLQVSNSCLQHVGLNNAALNAVPSRKEMYRDKSGFSTVETEYTCIKNYTQGRVNPKVLSADLPQGVTIEPFSKSLLPHVFAYDFSVVGYKRERLLELSCQEKKSRTLVAFQNGICVGFGSIKTSCLGAGRVGPLYADDSAVAEVLLRSLIIALPHVTSFAMMTVSTNVPARRFLQKLDCPKVQELTRLYKEERLSVMNTDKVFALFDLNFAPF